MSTRTPSLRFPEFSHAGEWEEKELGAISKIVRGGSPRPIDEFITKDPDGLNWLKIGDVAQDSKYITFTSERVLASALSKTREVNSGDLILSNSMSFGRPYILKISCCIHDGWIAITEISQSAFLDYLYYSILAPTSQNYFTNNAAGSGVQNLNADIIKLLPIALPSLPEQQKIADCLGSLDELITAHTRKLDALKTYKRGLMQQLLPQAGETVPSLRFPEFADAGEWEEGELGETCETYSGGTPNTSNSEFYGGSIPFIRSAEIDLNRTELFLTKEGFSNSAAKMVLKGDVLIALYGANSGEVALAKIDGAINQAILCIKHENNNRFVYHYLFHKKEWIISTYLQGGQGNLSGEIIRSIEISFPMPIEQEKIADCLSSLDELLAAHTRKLEALKTQKRGLMQQLFPSPDQP
jgi:type I restriction enzyme S subunit